MSPLLERQAELDGIGSALGRARDGRGSVVVVEGAAGIGKTALLAAACARAGDAGLTVLRARGGELEREIPFGVARQLLEPPLVAAPGAERTRLLSGAARLARPTLQLDDEQAPPSDPLAVLHGLYWVCANLCDRGPLVLAVDDAHWSDLPSLRWLAYLAHRIEGLPLVAFVTARPAEPGANHASVEAIAAEPAAVGMTLRPLGPDAVAHVVRARLEDAEDGFCSACHSASGGNPFLLRELLGAIGERGRQSAAHLDRLASAGVSRFVHDRLGRLGEPALGIARAAAVLGVATPLHRAARLVGTPLTEATGAADAMRAADILTGDRALDFVHPLVRSAVYRAIPAGARNDLHAAAARVLADEGAGVERVAAQLLLTDPRGDRWAVEQLRAAAERALESGAPDAAVALLLRALDEPPPAPERRAVHTSLGIAAFTLEPTLAVEHFRAALALATEPADRAAISEWLGKALGFVDRPDEGVAALGAMLEELAGSAPELALKVERSQLMWAHFWPDDPERPAHAARLAAITEGLPGNTPLERALLGLRAWDLVATGAASAAETLDIAERALGPGLVFTDLEFGFESPTLIAAEFMFLDELERAHDLFHGGYEDLRRHGWSVQNVFTLGHLTHVRVRQGMLHEAEAYAELAWELAVELGPTFPAWWFAFAPYLMVLIARGEADKGQALYASTGVGEAIPNAMIFPSPWVVRGELRVAAGDVERGVADLLAAGEWMEARGCHNPSWTGWRLTAAPALAALGRCEEAREIAAVAVDRARRFGAPSTLGAALRSAALADRGEATLPLLGESVAVLERGPARLEHATSLVALGSALRRAGRRAEARDPLRDGLDLAHRCGAAGLEREAREELLATGARPRSVVRSGAEALTTRERRVCELAARGHSNPEIAQELFVTRRTVESHLANAYRKLGITGRAELAGRLSA